MDITQELIDVVKRHPLLYDPSNADYKNTTKRDRVWNKIGNKFNTDAISLKKKWKNLRDCYAKHLRAKTKSKKCVDRYYNWPWASQMEIFKRFIKFTKNDSEITHCMLNTQLDCSGDSDCDDSKSTIESDCIDTKPDLLEISQSNISIETGGTNQTDSFLSENYDSTELIFLGYAKAIKKFARRRQAIIKLNIAQMIMEEELKQVEEESF